MTRPRQLLVMRGGGFSLDDHALALTGRRLPQGLLPADRLRRRRPLHRPLLPRLPGRSLPASQLREQELVYVGGGSVISLLGTRSAQGIDGMLRDAWEAGVVMAGLSAGSLCWFEHGTSSAPPG